MSKFLLLCILCTIWGVYEGHGQQAELLNDSLAAFDNFGTAVACSQDGQFLVVGAPLDDEGGTNRGSATVFLKADSSWVRISKLNAMDANDFDAFGTSVDISRDGQRILVGAPKAQSGASQDAGAAYLFFWTGATWSQLCKLVAPSPQNGAEFGASVSIDKNGTYLMVGEPGRGNPFAGRNDVGRAYVFTKGGGCVITPGLTLQADSLISDARFGHSVDIDDHGAFAIVGAPGEIGRTPAGPVGTGAAYIFEHDFSPDWSLLFRLQAPIVSNDFGWDVEMTNSLKYAVIGEPGFPLDTGRVFVYGGDTTIFSIDQILNGSSVGFGASASIDSTGDQVLVGSPQENQACLYMKLGDSLEVNAILSGDDIQFSNENYGSSVTLSKHGKYALVGAPAHRHAGISNAGGAYVDNICERCLEILRVKNENMQSTVYRANKFIEACIPLNNSMPVQFIAGDSILFGPGFFVPLGTEIETFLQDCDSGVN
jgi:hypothetical protein